MTTINPAEDTKTNTEDTTTNTESSKQNHDSGTWLFLKRGDSVVKYLQFAALVTAFVFDRLGTVEWFEEKYFWWMIGSAISLNFFIQSVHIILYYIVNKCAKDKYFWPRVFPKEWVAEDHGSGYSQHYKFFYFIKALLIAYIGFMIFQEKLDGFFIYWVFGLSIVLVIFDLCFYVFNLK